MTDRDAATARRRRLLDLVRYLMVGGISIVVDVGLLYVLHHYLGVVLAVATVIAFLTSLVVNFTLNRGGMAGRERAGLYRHALRYGLLVALNLVINLVVVTSASRVGISYLVAKLCVVAASTAWNFPLYRYWVFADEGGVDGTGAPDSRDAPSTLPT